MVYQLLMYKKFYLDIYGIGWVKCTTVKCATKGSF